MRYQGLTTIGESGKLFLGACPHHMCNGNLFREDRQGNREARRIYCKTCMSLFHDISGVQLRKAELIDKLVNRTFPTDRTGYHVLTEEREQMTQLLATRVNCELSRLEIEGIPITIEQLQNEMHF